MSDRPSAWSSGGASGCRSLPAGDGRCRSRQEVPARRRWGRRIAWVTFYPAVVICGLYGGWLTGVLSAGTSCLLALYAWPLMADQPFIKDYGDWLGMFAFLFNGAMISAVAEAARRARVRATEAREHAEVGQPCQERVPGEHEPRTAHAAQRDPRLLQTDARRSGPCLVSTARPSTSSAGAANTC